MVHESRTIWEVFEAIKTNDDGHNLWNLLEQITKSDVGVVYMTYGGETPKSLAERLDRQRSLKLIQLHRKLTVIRAHF